MGWELKTLSRGDEAKLEEFLAPRASDSMFLRSNARAAGLVDRGNPFEGTYVAAIEDGAVTAVAAHFWNGMLILQAPAPETLEPVARAAVARSGRELKGLTGPWAQVEATRRALGLAGREASLDSREELFSVDLADLRVPSPLSSGRVECRPPRGEELELAARWRMAFSVEALGRPDGEEALAAARSDIARLRDLGSQWILLDEGRPVAYSAFNARLPDVVQIGGVWTPPELRGRGYARAVVAGSLLEARRGGAARAILFTGVENVAASRAYEALGFRVVGDYGLVIFR
ncbi:MAG TPA: GNAT family N-acetyltransferase [Thermoanaerobaculia bacterium]|nr:GNAT family N-acetyltransferase [Thermoanaerobaculia bacterium]